MAEEFIIKSQDIEDKINQLLPSQGGFQAGVDFSASTMVIPIVDLTETAEGSSLRQDLQTSFSLSVSNSFSVNNTSTTVINTTGYFRIFGTFSCFTPSSGSQNGRVDITDGTTTKTLKRINISGTSGDGRNFYNDFDFVVKLEAGNSIIVVSSSTILTAIGATRQIADLAGNLTNP